MRAAAFTRLFFAAPQRFRALGIAARLAIVFVAVLALVLATTYAGTQRSRRAAVQIALIQSHYEPLARLAQKMSDAVARLSQATTEMASADARREPRRIDAMLTQIGDFASEYQELEPDSSALMREYAGKVASYELQARQLLVLADRRRGLVQQYRADFDAFNQQLHARTKTGSPPFADLAQAVGRLQDTFAAYASVGGIDSEHALADAEQNVRVVLDRATPLMDPVEATQLRDNLEKVIRDRRALVGFGALLNPARERFKDTSSTLAQFIDLRIGESARQGLATAAVDANRVAGDVNKSLWQLGLVTLSILLLISVATAYGVIMPVRQLVAAIRAFAEGQRGRRVTPGGVHELDTLGDAFNQMTERLEEAEGLVKLYQGQLEARVDERTRQLEHLAHHDPLTHLPNRRQLAQYLGRALEEAQATSSHVGVLFLDLDNFKSINDTLGHETGDALLKSVGERLARNSTHRVFIARLGGDEFTAIYCGLKSLDEVAALSRSMVESFQPSFDVEGRRLTISVSIGAAAYPQHGLDSAELLRAADAALSRAKEAGRNRFSVYGPELLRAATARFQTEQDLRHAIERSQFELFYQPVMSVDTLRVTAVEALLRWRRADGTVALPGEFIGIAERTGLIGDISNWLLETAVRQAATWRVSGWPEVRVAINVSPQQLFDATFHVRLESTLEKYALPAQCLEIELTETALQTGSGTIEAMHWLRSLGVRIALDDFGTGYSSLTSLQQLPLTRVKVDRSLVQDADSNPRSASILRTIISLCRDLALSVTIEGVERPAQFAMLRGHPSLQIQGFLVSPAIPVRDIREFIADAERTLKAVTTAPRNRGADNTSDDDTGTRRRGLS